MSSIQSVNMKLNRKLLLKICREKPHLARFLDISGLELATLERLNECGALHWLIASDNRLQSDDGLENLKHLWYLDLSNNQMAMLGALSRYLALGTLILSNNNLKWIDLEKIRHAHILSISLHGNPCLDSDQYYRIHVIDCLPLIWELDGRLVTVTERLHVKQFFIDTELTQHPVRHKMGKTFRTSAIKNIGTEGVVSKQCKYIYSKFPMSETHTKHTDERRLAYLTHMVQEDILQFNLQLEKGVPKKPVVSENFLDNLLEQRCKDPEGCDMMMLLLVISLEFQLPTALVRSVLSSANLDRIGTVSIMPFFLLPAKFRTRVICVLLNAAKIQRDNKKNQMGGLYPQLFMCLYHTVAQLTRISQTSEANMHKIKPIPIHSDYKALMAGEVVSLMLGVPRFFSYLLADSGVIGLATCATGSAEAVRKAQEILYEAEDIFSVMPVRTAHKLVKTVLFNAIQDRLNNINTRMLDIPIGDRYLSLSDSLPIKPLHSVIWATEFLTNGQCVPRLDPPILFPSRAAAKPKPQQPKIGDKVLLGPQTMGEFTMILEGDIAMTKIDAVPLPNGAVESRLRESDAHYTYVDLKNLCFARDISMWRPIKTEGDKHTIHSIEVSDIMTIAQKEASQTEALNSQPLKYTPITKTQMVYAPGALKSDVRAQSSSVIETKTSHSLDRKVFSAGGFNTNMNFALSFHEQADDAQDENDSNSNVQNEPVSMTNPYTSFQSGNVPDTPCLTINEDVSGAATEAPEPQILTETQPIDDNIPVQTKSKSPLQEALVQEPNSLLQNATGETSSNNLLKDIKSEKGQFSRGADDEQGDSVAEVGSPTPAQQVREENGEKPHSDNKNTDLDAKTPASDQENNHETLEDLTTKITLSGLDRNNSNSTHNIHPPSVVDAEDTFLTTVDRQSEGLDIFASLEDNSEFKGPQNTGSHSNKVLLSGNIDLMHQNPTEMLRRPKTSKLTSTSRIKAGSRMMPPSRPQSAADATHNFWNKNRTLLSSNEIGAKLWTFNDENDVLQTDVQELRKDVRKSLGQNRSWGNTTQGFSTTLPPPQRPTSPNTSIVIKTHGLKLTRTDTWLGGGRDLYWEDVRRRPKSGHTPGWKEGLPESMRKQRSKSAYVIPSSPGLAEILPATSRTKTLEALHSQLSHVTSAPDELDVTYLMPHSHQLLQHMPAPISSPVSDDSNMFLTFDPNNEAR